MRWDASHEDKEGLRRLDDACREARADGMRNLSLDELEAIARFGQGEMREEAAILLGRAYNPGRAVRVA